MSEAAPSKSPQVVAVIDLGSSAIRMTVAEISAHGDIRPLETVIKPVTLGKDVFSSRRISRAAALETIQILQSYQQIMKQYQVSHCRAVGTSAFREAYEPETLLDRIYMRTGIEVEVIETIEDNRLVYAAVRHAIGDVLAGEDTFFIEVGSGNTDITLQRKGQVTLAHSLRSGSLRLLQERGAGTPGRDVEIRAMRDRVESAAESLLRESPIGHVASFVAMGSEARRAAQYAGEQKERYAVLTVKQFRAFLREVERTPEDRIPEKFGIPYPDAETLAPAMLIYEKFIEITTPDRILAPMVSLRDGLLLDMAMMLSDKEDSDFSRQVVASAELLGRRCHYDEDHAKCVTALSLKLFDLMQEDHGLGRRERVLLEVAGILHDIGTFLSVNSHHKHGQYIAANSEIFGLRKSDMAIVGNVIRYHRRNLPGMQHPEYAALSRAERVTVSKLAALLRVADALDRGHRQQASRAKFRREGDQITITLPGQMDVSLERAGMPEKASLFENIYGMAVAVRGGVSHGA